MPLLWRYLLSNYLKIFLLNVTGFISILLVTRFQAIARFAATGASMLYTLKFILYQIPFILPLAIPISCLIAALLLFQRLSHSHELTALRVSGLGFYSIAYPVIACGALIGILNFTLVSEIAPPCRGLSKGLAYQMTVVNPLCLLQKETLIKLKNTYVDMKVLKSGRYAEDICFIMRNLSNQRLGVCLAKKLSLENQNLLGEGVTFISSIDSKNSDTFDHLIIENQAEMQTQSDQFTQYLRSSDWNFNYDYLSLRMLLAKYRTDTSKNFTLNSRFIQEIARRLSLGMAAFVFTLVGVSFGIDISRTRKYTRTLFAMALLAFYLICFVAAKSIKHHYSPSVGIYLAPHFLILFFCFRTLKQVEKGAL